MPRATTEDVDDVQQVIWPELDDSAEHKAVMSAAKKFHRCKQERLEVLGQLKEKQDNAELRLIGLMHENKLTKFKHKGLEVEISDGREKATVRTDDDSDDESGDE